jgi:hypothetical protein
MKQRGSTIWTVLAALIVALAAAGSAAVVVRELREQTRRETLRASVDTLAHFDAEWTSEDMAGVRGAAASSLLEKRLSRDIDDVLDFFDEIAFLIDRGAVDEETVWYRFYWSMANYWFASQTYVERVRQDDPEAWSELRQVMPRLAAIEMRRRRHASADGKPTEAQERDFLNDEVDAGQCSEETDDDVQRTPL